MLQWLVVLCTCLGVSLSQAQNSRTGLQQPDNTLPIPRNAFEIATYPNSNPLQQPEVRLEAVVTFVDNTTVFLQDNSGATFLNYPTANRKELFMPGQRIQIEGVRHPGLIIGGINPNKIEMVGIAPLPRPKRINHSELYSGRWHYHLVEVEGVVRSFQSTGESTGTMEINTLGGDIEVRFDQTPENPTALIDALIRVTGLASGVTNTQRQLISPYIRVRTPLHFNVIKPAPKKPFDLPVTLIGDIPGNVLHRIKVKGQALGPYISGGVFLRDESGTLFARLTQPPDFRTGDYLEVLGFVSVGSFNAQLNNAAAKIVKSGEPPIPNHPTASAMYDGRDGDLVKLRLQVLQRMETPGWTELLCQYGAVAIKIITRNPLDEKVGPGAEVEATGLCRVTRTTSSSRGHRAHPNSYDLLLRDDRDLILLSPTPWFTDEQLTTLLTGFVVLTLLAVIWAAILRVQISRQTRIIQDKVESEAVSEERRRIAREFHDTLEQELAGMSLRVDAASTRVTDGKAKGLLDELLKLLVRMQTETREFIWNLRDTAQTDVTLNEALRSMIEHQQSQTPTSISFTTSAHIPALSPLVQHQLLSIAGEAIHNALKYASARSIVVLLEVVDKVLHLQITDDGSGFNPDDVPAGHFGIQGMKERSRKIGARLQVESASGQGARVDVHYKL